MIDDPGGHEQRRLEGGVIGDVEDCSDQGKWRAHAQQRCDQAKMADRGIGQQTLEVALEQGGIGTDHQGDEAGESDDPEPAVRPRHYRPEPHQQEDTRFHHSG